MAGGLAGGLAALTRLRGAGSLSGHCWLRLALLSADKSAAALYDDVTQAGATRGGKRLAATPGGGGATGGSMSASSVRSMVAAITAVAGGLVRTNIPVKNTILRIAFTNKKQVLIPDVQKLINQLGNVNTDLFANRLVRPPTSVLLLPLRAGGVGERGGSW
jgi:hypothetical protein